MRFIREERGQAVGEYAVTLFLGVLVLIGVFGEFPAAIGRYYTWVASLVALPLP